MNKINEHLVEDLIRLRDELVPRAFEEHCDTPSRVKNTELAEIFFKINSCLYRGYPRRTH